MKAARAFEEQQRLKREEEELARQRQDQEFRERREQKLREKKEEEERKKAEEDTGSKKAEKQKAFKDKFSMFEKKEGPTEEERIKEGIVKASQGRRFEKQVRGARGVFCYAACNCV